MLSIGGLNSPHNHPFKMEEDHRKSKDRTLYSRGGGGGGGGGKKTNKKKREGGGGSG